MSVAAVVSAAAASHSAPRPAGSATFEATVLPLRPALMRAARALTRNQAEARDLVQDTLERALRTFDRFTPGSNARAWSMAILSRLFIDRWRRRRRQPLLVDIDCIELAAPEDDSLADPPPAWQELTMADMQQAAAALPHSLQRIFELSAFTRLSYGEISAVMGIPSSTVGTRLLRARRRLRVLLSERAGRLAPPRVRDDSGVDELPGRLSGVLPAPGRDRTRLRELVEA